MNLAAIRETKSGRSFLVIVLHSVIILKLYYHSENTRPVFQGTNVLNFYEHISVISNVLKPSYHETMPRQAGLRHILQLHSQESKNDYSDLLHTFNKVVIYTKKTLRSEDQCREFNLAKYFLLEDYI